MNPESAEMEVCKNQSLIVTVAWPTLGYSTYCHRLGEFVSRIPTV
jgi:hypothetical protein